MINFNDQGQLSLLDRSSAEGMKFIQNEYYDDIDSTILFTLVRERRPRTVIEIGSGFSTGIMRQALRAAGDRSTLTCIDPQPRRPIDADLHIAERAQDQARELFSRCDLLFIDGSHQVVQDGDVPFIIFEILPRLQGGALVHFHDIFLPKDYPPSWKERRYGEQYLVRLYLEAHPEARILWANQYMVGAYPEKIMAKFGHLLGPGSLWFEIPTGRGSDCEGP